jgi:ABC-2 type transport system ATP-binding protein
MDLARTLRLDLDAVTGTLSRGNLVKVNLCAAWGQEAKVLLLDEPTAGLDPVARVDMLHELRLFIDVHPKAAVIYATHLLDELRTINPGRLLVLRDGALREFDPTDTRGFDVDLLTAYMTGMRTLTVTEGAA